MQRYYFTKFVTLAFSVWDDMKEVRISHSLHLKAISHQTPGYSVLLGSVTTTLDSIDGATTMKAQCPECDAWITISVSLELWDLLSCPKCRTKLQLIDDDPLELDYADSDDDDDDDDDDDEDEDDDY